MYYYCDTMRFKSSDEFFYYVQHQLKLFCDNNEIKNAKFHTIFYNKLYYYGAKKLNFPVKTSWYRYGPYIIEYGEERRDDELLKVTSTLPQNIELKISSEPDSKIQGLIKELFNNYKYDSRNDSLYDFLKFIYSKKCDIPKAKEFYLAKLNLYNPIQQISSKKDDKDIKLDRIITDYQFHLLSKKFQNYIGMHEDHIDICLKYSDLLFDLDMNTKKSNSVLKSGLLDRINNEISILPCGSIAIKTTKNLDTVENMKYKAFQRKNIDKAYHKLDQEYEKYEIAVSGA